MLAMTRVFRFKFLLFIIGLYSIVQLLMAFWAPLLDERVYQFQAFFCHQQADRTLYVIGKQMGLCARCVGIYIGLFSFFLFELFNGDAQKFKKILYIAYLTTLIFGLEKMILLIAGLESTNMFRFFVGIGLGISLASIVEIIWKSPMRINNHG